MGGESATPFDDSYEDTEIVAMINVCASSLIDSITVAYYDTLSGEVFFTD